MYKVAIVDNDPESAQGLEACFGEYEKETGEQFRIVRYGSGLNFLEGDSSDFDLVFMDVDLPHLNGIETARKMRKTNSAAVLVYVTHLAKYAICGYEVGATDYVLKPVGYASLRSKIEHAVRIAKERCKRYVTLPMANGLLRVETDDLYYVEIVDHECIYHTRGREFRTHGTLAEMERILPAIQFARSHRGYLVNLKCVTRVEGNCIYVGSDKLMLSRSRKKAFLQALQRFATV